MNVKDSAETEGRPQKSLNDKQQEYQDLLIRSVAQHLGFSKGRPIAACIIYKCLRQWHSFEAERTSIYDKIIQTIGQAIEVPRRNFKIYGLMILVILLTLKTPFNRRLRTTMLS